MNENDLPKAEIKLDLTKTVENAYDDGFKEPIKSSSSAVSTVLDFFHNTVLYPMQKYNLYAQDKLQNYAIQLQNRTQSISSEFLTNPRVNILGPTIEGLKYNLDEEHIKEMFTNILVSDMDSRKQNKVLPSYIEIVKQLSKEDAKLLKFVKENNLLNGEPIIKLKIMHTNGGHTCPSNDIWLIINCIPQLIPAISIDNLSRLKIVETDFMVFRADQSIYDKAFEKIKDITSLGMIPDVVKNLNFSKGVLKVTDFGKNFIDICLS